MAKRESVDYIDELFGLRQEIKPLQLVQLFARKFGISEEAAIRRLKDLENQRYTYLDSNEYGAIVVKKTQKQHKKQHKFD